MDHKVYFGDHERPACGQLQCRQFADVSDFKMNEKNLRRLSRRDLLEMLLDLIKENEKLQKRNKQMEEILQDRVITILEAGSLAEASLQLNGVFQAAQNAADQYLFNVQKNCQKLEEDTRKKCEQMLLDAQSQGKDYEEKNE